MKRSIHFWPIVVVAALSLILYLNTLKNGFVLDDEDVIVNSSLIKDFSNLNKLFDKDYFTLSGEMTYRPVVTLSYFMDYKLSGLEPYGYHLTNIFLHALNSVLLYFFLALITRPSAVNNCDQPLLQPHLLVSVLFAAYPLLTEAVNVPSYREDILVFLFYISAFSLYLLVRSGAVGPRLSRVPLYSLSCILYSLALFSKEMAITLPFAIYCYEWIYFNKKKLPHPYNTGYIGITLAYIYIRFYYFHNPASLVKVYAPSWGILETLLTIPWLLLNYLKLTVFPISLSSDHIIDSVKSVSSILFVPPAVIIASILAMAIMGHKRKKGIAFGILYFFITLMPVYNIAPIAMPMAERYLYLPVSGLAIVAGSALGLIFEKLQTLKQAFLILVFLLFIAVLYSINTVKRNTIWGDDYLFWLKTVKVSPKSERAHLNLGAVYFDHGKLNEAAEEVKAAIEINPLDPQFYTLMGMIYAGQNSLDKAVSEFQTVLKLMPTHPGAHYNIGIAYLRKGLNIEARSEFEIALKLRPYYPKAKQAIEYLDKAGKGENLDFTDVYFQ